MAIRSYVRSSRENSVFCLCLGSSACRHCLTSDIRRNNFLSLYSQYELVSSLLKVWQQNPRLKAFRNLILIRTKSVCGQRAACNATVARPALALLQTSQLEPAPSRPAGRRTGIGRTRRSAGRLAGRGLAGGAAIAADFSVAAAAAVTPRKPQSRDARVWLVNYQGGLCLLYIA